MRLDPDSFDLGYETAQGEAIGEIKDAYHQGMTDAVNMLKAKIGQAALIHAETGLMRSLLLEMEALRDVS